MPLTKLEHYLVLTDNIDATRLQLLRQHDRVVDVPLAAFAVEPCAAFIAHFKRHLEMVEKAMGGLLVLTGIAFLTGFVTEASFYLLEWFPALGRIG